MAADYGYNPSAGYNAPPGNSVDPNYAPYGNIYNNNAHRPRHSAYDPQTGHPIPPGFEPPQGEGTQNYPPPPRDDQYGGDPYGRPPPGRAEYERGYYEGPGSDYGYPRGPGYVDPNRPYAPDDPYPHDGNALTPFDEEKYEAEVRDEQERRYAAQQAQQGDYFSRDGRRGVYPADRRYDSRDRYDDRYSEDSYYDPRDVRDRRYEDDRERERRYDERRRDSRQKDEPRSPTKKSKDIFDGREAQVLGGAAGGLLGSQFGGGVLETLGGAVVGAVGAKVLEKQKIKRDGKKLSGATGPMTRDEAQLRREAHGRGGRRDDRRDMPRDESRYDPRDDPRRDPRDRGGLPGGGRSRSRGPRDDYYYSDEYSPSPPPGPGRR